MIPINLCRLFRWYLNELIFLDSSCLRLLTSCNYVHLYHCSPPMLFDNWWKGLDPLFIFYSYFCVFFMHYYSESNKAEHRNICSGPTQRTEHELCRMAQQTWPEVQEAGCLWRPRQLFLQALRRCCWCQKGTLRQLHWCRKISSIIKHLLTCSIYAFKIHIWSMSWTFLVQSPQSECNLNFFNGWKKYVRKFFQLTGFLCSNFISGWMTDLISKTFYWVSF